MFRNYVYVNDFLLVEYYVNLKDDLTKIIRKPYSEWLVDIDL